jgi:hypothetical protein
MDLTWRGVTAATVEVKRHCEPQAMSAPPRIVKQAKALSDLLPDIALIPIEEL